MPEPITYNSIVSAVGHLGTVVSISKTHYGVKFTGGEVGYFSHALVTK